MTRIRLNLSYDGAFFHGWAVQPGLPTIQEAVEAAVSLQLREPIRLTVAGRTDAGVHASGQVVHFDTSQTDLPAWGQADSVFVSRLNRILERVLANAIAPAAFSSLLVNPESAERPLYPKGAPGAVVVHQAGVVPPEFNARFCALARHYTYRMVDHSQARNPLTRHICWWYPQELDASAMIEAAQLFLGTHDFAAFCKPRQGATTIRTLKKLEVLRPQPGTLQLNVSADAFCHSMVRSLVGAITEVGVARRDCAWIKAALASQSRVSQIPVAPAQGLTLQSVDYPALNPSELLARQSQTRQLRA